MPQSLRKPQRLPENPTANVQVARRSGINAEQNKQRPPETAAFSREGRLPETQSGSRPPTVPPERGHPFTVRKTGYLKT
ncbi:hypothetical protein [Neisseria subflava]|uniref:hypothetical protein n=1 Tax=Neisseria subflava TaxID=28449 RepID=UPI0027DF84F8|nr:hypothetical protein [Neisseria subflava]